jgi:type IV pilus biogenesis protein CpaD/CtpE
MQVVNFLGLAAAVMLLAGCTDPFQRPEDWSMTGAARENTALQVAQPSDLFNGKSSPTSNGVAASAAIDKAVGGAAGTATGLQTAPQPIAQAGS